MNDHTFIWLLGAMLVFGIGIGRDEKLTIWKLLGFMLTCAIIWPMELGYEIKKWMDWEK